MKVKQRLTMDPSWAGRRRVIRLSLLACLGLSVYSMYLGHEMAGVVFPPLALLAGSIIGSYVFGAAWERSNNVPSMNSLKQLEPAQQQELPLKLETGKP